MAIANEQDTGERKFIPFKRLAGKAGLTNAQIILMRHRHGDAVMEANLENLTRNALKQGSTLLIEGYSYQETFEPMEGIPPHQIRGWDDEELFRRSIELRDERGPQFDLVIQQRTQKMLENIRQALEDGAQSVIVWGGLEHLMGELGAEPILRASTYKFLILEVEGESLSGQQMSERVEEYRRRSQIH